MDDRSLKNGIVGRSAIDHHELGHLETWVSSWPIVMDKSMHPSGVTVSPTNPTNGVGLFFNSVLINPKASYVIRGRIFADAPPSTSSLLTCTLSIRGEITNASLQGEWTPSKSESDKKIGQVGFYTWAAQTSCLASLANSFLLFLD